MANIKKYKRDITNEAHKIYDNMIYAASNYLKEKYKDGNYLNGREASEVNINLPYNSQRIEAKPLYVIIDNMALTRKEYDDMRKYAETVIKQLQNTANDDYSKATNTVEKMFKKYLHQNWLCKDYNHAEEIFNEIYNKAYKEAEQYYLQKCVKGDDEFAELLEKFNKEQPLDYGRFNELIKQYYGTFENFECHILSKVVSML